MENLATISLTEGNGPVTVSGNQVVNYHIPSYSLSLSEIESYQLAHQNRGDSDEDNPSEYELRHLYPDESSMSTETTETSETSETAETLDRESAESETKKTSQEVCGITIVAGVKRKVEPVC